VELNLKNARRLEQSIDSAINDMRDGGSVVVSIYDTAGPSTIADSPTVTMSHLETIHKLTEARYHIRGLIGTANETCGLNSWMITECVLKDRLHQLLSAINRGTILTDKEIKVKVGQWQAKVDGNIDTYSSNRDSLVLNSPLTLENYMDLKRQVKDVKKDLNRISDTCSNLNLNTTIAIDSDIVTVLECTDLV